MLLQRGRKLLRLHRKPRPIVRAGQSGASLLAVLAGPRPQQGEAFASLVVEQVRVDRSVEGGIVELEREIVATFLGTLRPRCTDLGSAHVDAVTRSIVVGASGLGDDADAFGLQAEGDDLALEIVLGQLATVFLK